jgi:hypothetical protein
MWTGKTYLAHEERKVMVTERFTSPWNMAVCTSIVIVRF